MESSRRHKIRSLYKEIDELDDELAKVTKSEKAKIRRRVAILRQEVERALEPGTNNAPSIVPRSDPVKHGASEGRKRNYPRQPAAKTQPRKSKPNNKLRNASGQSPAESAPKKGQKKPPNAELQKDQAPPKVRKLEVADYLYQRRSELVEITRCGKGTKREKARDELSFLHEQLNILYRDKRWEKQLDPTLVKKVSEKPASTSSRKSTETFDLRVEKASAQPASRPAYVRKCRKMSFRQLREFIDDSLRAFPESTSDSEAPNSYDEFIELWEMLRKKVNVPELPPMPPKPGPTPEFPEFVASEQLKQQLQASFDQQEQLTDLCGSC